jgi:hypothetical protein
VVIDSDEYNLLSRCKKAPRVIAPKHLPARVVTGYESLERKGFVTGCKDRLVSLTPAGIEALDEYERADA